MMSGESSAHNMFPATAKALRFLALLAAVLIGSTAGTALFLKLFLASQHDHFIDVLEVLTSPDGAHMAIVGEEWDGAGAAMSCRQFVLLRPGSATSDANGFSWGEPDQVFGTYCGAGDDYPQVQVVWKDARQLVVRYGSKSSSQLVGVWRRSRNLIDDVDVEVQSSD